MRTHRSIPLIFVLSIVVTISGCTSFIPKIFDRSSGSSDRTSTEEVQPIESKELEIVVLHKATYNPYERNNGKSFMPISTAEDYLAELNRHSIETPKPVDFATMQVLVSSIGEKPTGGYKVTATKAEELADRVIVTVVQTAPGPSCINTTAVTHPFEIVTIPSLKPIEIFERKKTEDC